MKRAVLAIALCACGGGRDAPPAEPAVLASPSSPGAALPACPGGAVAGQPGCRVDGHTNLDNDGVVDCWRAETTHVWLWPGCAGAPIELDVAWDPVSTIILPEPQRTPEWIRAVSVALVGAARLSPPRWIDGAPAFPTPWVDLTDDQAIRVSFPGSGVAPADRQLGLAATCEPWEVWTAPHVTVAADRRRGAWRVLDLEHGGDAACIDGIVLQSGHTGVDSLTLDAIDPTSGHRESFVLDAYEWRWMIGAGGLRTGRGWVSFARLRVMMAPPIVFTPCDGAPPVLALTPAKPCALEGKSASGDCWRVEYTGVDWRIGVDPGCRGDRAWEELALDEALTHVDRYTESMTDEQQRDVATLLVGASELPCLTPRRGCAPADPALLWMRDRVASHGGRGDGSGWTRPVWQSGAPALPGTVVGESDGRVLVRPRTDATLAALGECPRYTVWAAAAGAAVVDRRTHRWAWIYLAGPKDLDLPGGAPPAVGRGWCEADLAYLELAPASVVVADPALGTWSIVPPEEWEWVKDRPDRAAQLRRRLAAAKRGEYFPLEDSK